MQTTTINTNKNFISDRQPAHIEARNMGFKMPEFSRLERLSEGEQKVIRGIVYAATSEQEVVKMIDHTFPPEGFRYSKLADVACEEFRSITGVLH